MRRGRSPDCISVEGSSRHRGSARPRRLPLQSTIEISVDGKPCATAGSSSRNSTLALSSLLVSWRGLAFPLIRAWSSHTADTPPSGSIAAATHKRGPPERADLRSRISPGFLRCTLPALGKKPTPQSAQRPIPPHSPRPETLPRPSVPPLPPCPHAFKWH